MPKRNLPFISIIVAARNEASNINRCLQSLSTLDYPKDKFEVLVGDDASEDGTPWLIELFARKHRHFYLFQISEQIGKAKGKANVLAQLIGYSKGELLLFTDADIAVNPLWAKEMVESAQGHAIVTGYTIVERKGLFARLQSADWSLAQGLAEPISNLGVPVTAMGNNMLVSREAYTLTGGFGSLEFSITEDIQLFNEIVRNKGSFKTVINPQSVVETKAVKSWGQLISQRKRWMHGAMQTAYLFRLPILLQCLSLVIYALLALTSIKILFLILAVKMLAQALVVVRTNMKAGETTDLQIHFIYEFYLCTLSFFTLMSYLTTAKTKWKGRSY